MAESDDRSPIGTNLAVFLLGVAVGATVAILYAPAAGTETRQQIGEKAGQLKDRAGEITHQVADKAATIKTQVVEKAGEIKARITHIGNEAAEKIEAVETALDGEAASA